MTDDRPVNMAVSRLDRDGLWPAREVGGRPATSVPLRKAGQFHRKSI